MRAIPGQFRENANAHVTDFLTATAGFNSIFSGSTACKDALLNAP
jgi:hypothetical protein